MRRPTGADTLLSTPTLLTPAGRARHAPCYLIVGITAVAALFLYIDRVCISILADDMKGDLALSDAEKENVLSAFFFTYALFQIPVGVADRYGPRLVLTVSIAAWSVVTAMTGLAWSFGALIAARLLLHHGSPGLTRRQRGW